MKSEDYISIIGTSYIFPITLILEELETMSVRGPNDVQASPRENGCSAGVIAISVLFLESIIGRIQYIKEISPPLKPIDYVSKSFSSTRYPKTLTELFVIRDVIVHNHVWETKFYWDEDYQMRLVDAKIVNGYGDRKFRSIIDEDQRKTKVLHLNLFPTRICRDDAVIVLKEIVDFLLFLENKDRNLVYISPQYVKYKGRMILFVDIIQNLEA